MLDEGKGLDTVLLDLAKICSFADYFIIVTGDNPIHMRALADRVRDALAKKGAHITSSEGRESKSWVLLDYGAIIVHVMSKKAREYYGLEKLWGDARVIQWKDD